MAYVTCQAPSLYTTMTMIQKKPVAVLFVILVLSACGHDDESITAETPPAETPIATTVVDMPATPAAPVPASPLAVLRSADAPFACDVLKPEDLKVIFDVEVQVRDVTAQRESHALVDSICQFDFDPAKPFTVSGRSFKSVRVDVLTDRTLRAENAGNMQMQWTYRVGDESRSFALRDGLRAAWVESDHPPDQSLLVRMGEVMLELRYYPPSSFRGSPEANTYIEELASLMLQHFEKP